jgi:hypothetical protein
LTFPGHVTARLFPACVYQALRLNSLAMLAFGFVRNHFP